MHEMNVMSSRGHDTIRWDAATGVGVKSAETMFDELLGKGYRAFRQGDGNQDGPMKSFDPRASEIVMCNASPRRLSVPFNPIGGVPRRCRNRAERRFCFGETDEHIHRLSNELQHHHTHHYGGHAQPSGARA